jgi:hypothetical protein
MDKIGEQLQMSKTVHSVIQLLLTAVNGIDAVSNFVPMKYKIWITIGISAIQGVIGVLNHFDTETVSTTTTTSISADKLS